MQATPADRISYRYRAGRAHDAGWATATAPANEPFLVTLPGGDVIDLLSRPSLFFLAGCRTSDQTRRADEGFLAGVHDNPEAQVDLAYAAAICGATVEQIGRYIVPILSRLASVPDKPALTRHDAAAVALLAADRLGFAVSGAKWCARDITVRRLDITASPEAIASFAATLTPAARAAIAGSALIPSPISISRPSEDMADGIYVPPGTYTAARATLKSLRAAGGDLVLDPAGGDPRVVMRPGGRMPDDLAADLRRHLGACIDILEARDSWAQAAADRLVTDATPLILAAAMEEADRAATSLSLTPPVNPEAPQGIEQFLHHLADLDLLPTHIDSTTGWPMPPDLARWMAAPEDIKAGWVQHTDALRSRCLASQVVTLADLRAAGFDARLSRSGIYTHLSIAPLVRWEEEPDGWPGNRIKAEQEAAGRKMQQDLWMRVMYSSARIAAELIQEAGGDAVDFADTIRVTAPTNTRPPGDAPSHFSVIHTPSKFCADAAARAFVDAAHGGHLTRKEAISIALDAIVGPPTSGRYAIIAPLLHAASAVALLPAEQAADLDTSQVPRLPPQVDEWHCAAHQMARLSPIAAMRGIAEALSDVPGMENAVRAIVGACKKAGFEDPDGDGRGENKAA